MVRTPREYEISWRGTPIGGEGTSHFGRYIHTCDEDGTHTVEFIGKGRSEVRARRPIAWSLVTVQAQLLQERPLGGERLLSPASNRLGTDRIAVALRTLLVPHVAPDRYIHVFKT